MDFIEATDRIAGGVTHAELAEELGVSVQAIRQARLAPSNPNYRRPPDGWPAAVAKLAERRGGELHKLAEELRKEAGGVNTTERDAAGSRTPTRGTCG